MEVEWKILFFSIWWFFWLAAVHFPGCIYMERTSSPIISTNIKSSYTFTMCFFLKYKISSWWFQPSWKIISQLGSFPQVGMKIQNIWNHHLDILIMQCHAVRFLPMKPIMEGNYCNPLFFLVHLAHPAKKMCRMFIQEVTQEHLKVCSKKQEDVLRLYQCLFWKKNIKKLKSVASLDEKSWP